MAGRRTRSVSELALTERPPLNSTTSTTSSNTATKPARLVHVDQYYLRTDTIAAANGRLVAA